MSEMIIDNLTINQIPIPVCVVDMKGKIVDANDGIEQVFIYDEIKDYDFFALVGFSIESLLEAAEDGRTKTIDRNKKTFSLSPVMTGEGENRKVFVYFNDISRYEELKEKYDMERVCVASVSLDNYDEMKSNMGLDERLPIWTEADKIVRKWAAGMDGTVISSNSSDYRIFFEARHVNALIKSKFSVLDDIRAIDAPNDFPMSLSIGVGISSNGVVESREFADAALDLALGRGGDQAVVKRGNRIDYYGGRMQSVEKGNKGKSRVISHALVRLIEQADRIMIMGHRNPDLDALGSALGIYRFCQLKGRSAIIVISELNDSMQAFYKSAKDLDIYTFMNKDKALSLADEKTLLIVLDTHRPSYVECRELLEKAGQIAVIDHHRRAADSIKNPALAYIESYASSTAELVTEILQYAGARKNLIKFEAEALLAGMTVDTNRFAVKTGVRTFEAAAWLRRAGADTTEVKRLFQSDIKDLRARAKAIANAEVGKNGIAMSLLEGFNENAQVLNSQIADELLNVKGVKASFVAGRDETGLTVISARSLGEINVQIIMEKLGGGGHLTTAGAQSDDSPEEVLEIVRNILESGSGSEGK